MDSLSNKETRLALLARFERASELPLIILAVIMGVLLVLPVLIEVPENWKETITTIDWLIWAVFAADLLIRVFLADHRLAYLRRHWLDVVIVLVPFLRPLRVLRLLRVAVLLGRAATGAHGMIHVPQVVLASATLTVSIGIVMWLIESRVEGGNIKTLGDGLWWAMVTVSTLGYGDKFPVTPLGRGVAVVLIIGGIALFSALSGSLAAFLLRPRNSNAEDKLAEKYSVQALEARLARLERLLEERLPSADGREADQAERDLIR